MIDTLQKILQNTLNSIKRGKILRQLEYPLYGSKDASRPPLSNVLSLVSVNQLPDSRQLYIWDIPYNAVVSLKRCTKTSSFQHTYISVPCKKKSTLTSVELFKVGLLPNFLGKNAKKLIFSLFFYWSADTGRRVHI